jgi:chromosome segregation ATPase
MATMEEELEGFQEEERKIKQQQQQVEREQRERTARITELERTIEQDREQLRTVHRGLEANAHAKKDNLEEANEYYKNDELQQINREIERLRDDVSGLSMKYTISR